MKSGHYSIVYLIEEKKTMSVSIYKQLNAKMDIKHITYFTDINWQKMAKRDAGAFVRYIMFAMMLHHKNQCLGRSALTNLTPPPMLLF